MSKTRLAISSKTINANDNVAFEETSLAA